jgi:uroporphyrinogen decarboxylase
MNSKERITMLLSGEISDRIGKVDAPWPETRRRWYDEGLPPGIHASDFFEMDIRVNIRTLPTFQLEEKVVEENHQFQVISDADGNVTKYWKDKSGVPLPLKNAITSREDWDRLKDRLVPNEKRFAFGYYGNYMHEYAHGDISEVKAAYDAYPHLADTFVIMEVADPYEFAMAKMGDERILMKMAMEPDLLTDMWEAYVNLVIGNCEILFGAGFKPDGCFLGGDIAYKNGLLFSPKMYRELVFPYLKRIIDHLKHERGLKIIYHTDGNPTEAIPILVEAGIDCLQPLEVNAGMDVRKLVGEWGDRIAFMGNISTQTMAGPTDKLEDAVRSRIEACTKTRVRYMIHSDHSIPDTVSFANFRFMMDLVDKYGGY